MHTQEELIVLAVIKRAVGDDIVMVQQPHIEDAQQQVALSGYINKSGVFHT